MIVEPPGVTAVVNHRLGSPDFVEIPYQSLLGICFWKRHLTHFANCLRFQYACAFEFTIPDEGQEEAS
jgi:hypothetical protein